MQRALGIGYGRAARLIDFMAEDGIVGQYNGCQARDVLITLEDWERMQGLASEEAAAAETTEPPKRRNKILPEPWADEQDEAASDEIADEQIDDESNDDESATDDQDANDEYQAESA